MHEKKYKSTLEETADLLEQAFAGKITIADTKDPKVFKYALHQPPTCDIVKTAVDNILQLTHHHSYQWLIADKEPPSIIKNNCLRYIEMRKKKEQSK